MAIQISANVLPAVMLNELSVYVRLCHLLLNFGLNYPLPAIEAVRLIYVFVLLNLKRIVD